MKPTDLHGSVEERIISVVVAESDLQLIRAKLHMLLDEYDISPREREIVPYTEGKNEMLLKRFILAKTVAGRTERTVRQYYAEIKRSLQRIGKDADTIVTADVQAYLAQLMIAGNSKSYCDTVRRYLSSFFKYLSKEELIVKNPMDRVDNIKYHTEKESAFSDMEIEKMRVACKNNFQRAMFETLLSTGCRASEIVSIKTNDMKDGKIDIVGKGEKHRTVYINAKASVAIERYMQERNDSNPFLFPGGVFGTDGSKKHDWYKNAENVSAYRHYSPSSVNNLVRGIARRANVKGAHAHRFRRSCATHALRHGMPIEMVSMMLGHEKISTTQIYLDVREEDLKNAHQKYVI